jgi:hypothetical protein
MKYAGLGWKYNNNNNNKGVCNSTWCLFIWNLIMNTKVCVIIIKISFNFMLTSPNMQFRLYKWLRVEYQSSPHTPKIILATMAFWSRIGRGESGRVTKRHYTWSSCTDAKLTDDSCGRLFHTTSHKARIWFTQLCLSIAVDTVGIKDGVHSLRWSISYVIFECSPFCTLHIKTHESIHWLCSTEEVVIMQPLKKTLQFT